MEEKEIIPDKILCTECRRKEWYWKTLKTERFNKDPKNKIPRYICSSCICKLEEKKIIRYEEWRINRETKFARNW